MCVGQEHSTIPGLMQSAAGGPNYSAADRQLDQAADAAMREPLACPRFVFPIFPDASRWQISFPIQLSHTDVFLCRLLNGDQIVRYRVYATNPDADGDRPVAALTALADEMEAVVRGLRQMAAAGDTVIEEAK